MKELIQLKDDIRQQLGQGRQLRFDIQHGVKETLKPLILPLQKIAATRRVTKQVAAIHDSPYSVTDDDDDEEDITYFPQTKLDLTPDNPEYFDDIFGPRVITANPPTYTLGDLPYVEDKVNKKIKIGDKEFELTPGVQELIWGKYPHKYKESDKAIYHQILLTTNVHRKSFSPTGKLRSDRGFKYRRIIKPLVNPKKKYKGRGLEEARRIQAISFKRSGHFTKHGVFRV